MFYEFANVLFSSAEEPIRGIASAQWGAHSTRAAARIHTQQCACEVRRSFRAARRAATEPSTNRSDLISNVCTKG